MPDILWGAPKDAKGYDYDLAKAKEYVAKAAAEGAPMKRVFELHVQSENEQSVQGAQLFQADLAQSEQLTMEKWSNRGLWLRVQEMSAGMWEYWL